MSDSDDISDVATLNALLSSSAGREQRVWGYLRVSSRKREREGLSMAGQREAIVSYCQQQSLPPPRFIREVASASKPLLETHLPGSAETSGGEGSEDRPMIAAALSALSDRSCGTRHFIIWKLDRLSRFGIEQEMLLDLLRRGGTHTHSTLASERAILEGDLHDPQRVMMRQILATVAQYERHLIQVRMQLGARAKAARGQCITSAVPPGYRMVSKDLAVDPQGAHEVRVVYYLRQLNLSYKQIATELPRRFHVPPFGRMKIARILDRESLYRGTYTDPFGGVHKRPDLRILPDDWQVWAEEHDPEYLRYPVGAVS